MQSSDFLQENVLLTVPILLHQMLFLRDLHTLSGLRQFVAAESPLKVMKNAFNFTLEALLILKIINSLPGRCPPVEK